MTRIWTVAFCGAGNVVRNHHLPALEERGDRYRVVGFFDVDGQKARERAGDKYKVYGQYRELLADRDVEIVVVATKPLATHYPAARDALAAGKHVLLEKPMASTTAECDALLDLAREKGRLLTVHHNRRLDLDFLAMQDLIRKGKVGEPAFIENRVPCDGYDGGDFVDWGVHLADQALLLNRSALVEVSGFLAKPAEGVANGGYGEGTLRFERPPLVRIAMMPRCQEFLLNGTPAAARFYVAGSLASFTQRVIEDPRDLMNATVSFDRARPDYAVPAYLEVRRKGYYDYLYESLSQGAPLLVKAEQARNAIRLLELLGESAKANRAIPASKMLPVPVD
ncbi:MAG: Gfo/Idh/MocA family oxidoreductase [Planctomycetota bacterium]